jgi:hypothetical protein
MERGETEMRLDQAIELLRGRPGSIEHLGEEFTQRARAAAVIGDAYRDGALETVAMRPARTHDAALSIPSSKPRKGGRMHIHVHSFTRDDNGAEVERGDADGVNGAQKATRSGAKLVQVLEGDATAYFVANDGQGRACLYRTVETNGAMDPGKVSVKSKTLSADARRAVARDADRSNVLLRTINERNRSYWSNR